MPCPLHVSLTSTRKDLDFPDILSLLRARSSASALHLCIPCLKAPSKRTADDHYHLVGVLSDVLSFPTPPISLHLPKVLRPDPERKDPWDVRTGMLVGDVGERGTAVFLCMAPVPPRLAVPKLRLEVPDLLHPGVEAFFKAAPAPGDALRTAVERVLAKLYPHTLSSSVLPTSSASSSSSSSVTSASHVFPAPVRSVTLHLRAFDGVAYTCGSDLDAEHKELHLSASYLEDVSNGCGGDVAHLKLEVEGVLVHELVHAFQYDGEGTVPGGVIEGIADWVRDKAGVGAPHWREQPSEEDKWDSGYSTTAYFLRWLSSHLHNPLLVPQLNLALRTHEWDDGSHLQRLLGGKDVEKLWEVYRKELAKKGESDEEPPKPVPTHGARSGYGVGY
ncbi:hypothetical protein JCM8097_006637 [Rhodosporidiobolus ruineniae]